MPPVEASPSLLSLHHAELAVRLLVGVALGGLIGLERNEEDRFFGLRIHMLTALAAAGFSVLAFEAADAARLRNIRGTFVCHPRRPAQTVKVAPIRSESTPHGHPHADQRALHEIP